MQIRYSSPYSLDKRLDAAFNEEMAGLQPGDWMCFVDADAMFLIPNFGHQIAALISANHEYDLFTCMVNRVGTQYQVHPGVWESDDIRLHRKVAAQRWREHGTTVSDITDGAPLSGTLMLLSKRGWAESGGFTTEGILGVDNSIHYNVRNAGLRIGLMEGIYLYHWYRGGNKKDKAHLL